MKLKPPLIHLAIQGKFSNFFSKQIRITIFTRMQELSRTDSNILPLHNFWYHLSYMRQSHKLTIKMELWISLEKRIANTHEKTQVTHLKSYAIYILEITCHLHLHENVYTFLRLTCELTLATEGPCISRTRQTSALPLHAER